MEGPSIHLLAEELQIFVNQKIIKIFGNAGFDKEPLLHQTIKEIFPFGKRLVIQLDTHIIVIHFLMYGSYRIDTTKLGFTPRIALITGKHSLYFYNCACKCLKKNNVRKKLDFDFDILSPTWNIKKIIKTIQLHPNENIDDILLDQEIFLGVGNIIKNEALFLSKIAPHKKIRQLSAKRLKEIAFNTRLFSQRFLELRKKFELKKNLQIYRKKKCPRCNSQVIRKKTGKRNRWSFYCLTCQH